ncbi:hypothetical protein [Actinoallomurus sp. NPDC050550]|uniref:hypothetical protein n=1 Tax=Actinoallomurus sp. NPDC050550 TaxID=3154937 RepID=UPI0033F788E0
MTQFVLQFIYIPLWVLIAVGLTVLAIWADSASNANIGPPGAAFGFAQAAISWRRFRVEWSGRAADWAPFTDALLKERFSRGEKNSGWNVATLPPSGVRRATTDLPVRYYRGLSPAQVEHLARLRGWSVDWASSKPADRLCFFRLMPPPVQVGLPHPYGPPPAPGTPWGPLSFRVAMPLLTWVFMPRLRALELRRNPDAYLTHLRKYLPERFKAELARDPRKNYQADEAGRILRRVSVSTWHFRGVGAQAVLRVAAEQGWQLDHSFPAEPGTTLHLCRLDDLARPRS